MTFYYRYTDTRPSALISFWSINSTNSTMQKECRDYLHIWKNGYVYRVDNLGASHKFSSIKLWEF